MKVGLLLEGGALRGIFSAGVMDVLLDNSIIIDGIIGVSAGALFGPNYFSKQKGRVLRYNSKYINDKRYISIRNLLLTGNMISKNFAFYKMNNQLDRFDNETFKKENKEFIAVATNVKTAKAEYFQIKDPLKDMEILRASSAMPAVSKMVKINNNKYLDGGIADSIPIEKMLSLNYDKIIIILTQPINYQKQSINNNRFKYIKFKYRHYPELIKVMENRYSVYNEKISKIKDLEKQGKVFVIRPKEKINIEILKCDKNDIKRVYDMGVEEAKKNIKKLKNYLAK